MHERMVSFYSRVRAENSVLMAAKDFLQQKRPERDTQHSGTFCDYFSTIEEGPILYLISSSYTKTGRSHCLRTKKSCSHIWTSQESSFPVKSVLFAASHSQNWMNPMLSTTGSLTCSAELRDQKDHSFWTDCHVFCKVGCLRFRSSSILR